VRRPDIHLELATSAKNGVTGDAEVLIDATPVFAYAAKGKYKPAADTTSLKLARLDPAARTKVTLKSVVLEAGTATSGLVTFKIAGQKGIAQLPVPLLAVH
jgi:hypothetical protein